MGGDIHNVELKESSTNSMLIDALLSHYSDQMTSPLRHFEDQSCSWSVCSLICSSYSYLCSTERAETSAQALAATGFDMRKVRLEYVHPHLWSRDNKGTGRNI